jgi:hypothetical protein
MRETYVEVILQRAKEKYLEAKPRIISDPTMARSSSLATSRSSFASRA